MADTRESLKADGWFFLGLRKCLGRHCGAEMEIWRKPCVATRVYDHVGEFQSHFITCPDRADFKNDEHKFKLRRRKLNLKQGRLF